jgi:hypothetical protein
VQGNRKPSRTRFEVPPWKIEVSSFTTSIIFAPNFLRAQLDARNSGSFRDTGGHGKKKSADEECEAEYSDIRSEPAKLHAWRSAASQGLR